MPLLTFRSRLSNRLLYWASFSDILNKRVEELNSLKEVLCGSVPERHLRFQSAEEFLCMANIANAVHIRIFLLQRALPLGDFRQIGHEPLNKTFEESHRDEDRRRRESADEQSDVRQIPIDCKRIRIFRYGVGSHGESSEHPRMTIAHFFPEIVQDDRAGFLRPDGEIGAGHPVNEIPFEHRGVASDDPTPLLGGK